MFLPWYPIFATSHVYTFLMMILILIRWCTTSHVCFCIHVYTLDGAQLPMYVCIHQLFIHGHSVFVLKMCKTEIETQIAVNYSVGWVQTFFLTKSHHKAFDPICDDLYRFYFILA